MAGIAKLTYLVRDYDEAVAWFAGMLDFAALTDADLGGGKCWVTVAPKDGGMTLLLAKAASPQQAARVGDQTGGRVFLFLETEDFARDHAALAARGVKFREAPRHEAYGWVAVFEDLYGNLWDLLEVKA
jgi:catechol 2,3-dioxygenase-like lactoylglutathione lyase family enzyme